MHKRLTALALVLLLALVMCAKEEQETTEITAPYYASLAEAMREAGTDQYIVVDFYTQW